MKLTLPYPPTLNNMKAVVRGRLITTRQARDYMALCSSLARQQGATPLDGPVVVRVWAHRPRKAGDLDNTLKAAFDALKGIAWGDDSQVVEIYATRHDDKHNPRLEIEVDTFVSADAPPPPPRNLPDETPAEKFRRLATSATYRSGT